MAALVFALLVFGLHGGTQTQAVDPCTSAMLINEPLRSTGYVVKDKDYENLNCDRLLPLGWYKFTAGNQMPTTCPAQYTCGTHVPIWLNGKHPSPADGIVSIETCSHTDIGCCALKNVIRVKNCGTFYAYELKPAPGCSAAYCAGNGVPCPPDQWSTTGFTPGCMPAFPKMTQSPHLSPPIVKPNTFEFNCHIPFDPSRKDVGFQVMWLFDGKPDSKIPKMQATGSDRDVAMDQKYLEGHLGTDVTCEVMTYFLSSTGRKGPPVRSNPYWAGIKLSTPRLTVGENEKPKTVQMISTIPIVCSKASQATCKLEVYLDPNNHDIRQTTKCTQVLRPTDWNPVTHQAVTSFQVLAERDYKKDGDKNLALHFRPIFSVDVPPVFNNYQIPYLQILTKDKSSGLCSCTGDPHCRTMDMQHTRVHNVYNYYKVGEFTMYKSTSRPFEVQARTWHCGHVSCNCAVAAREGNDVVIIDLCHGAYGHTFPKVIIQHKGQISQGTVVHRSNNGRQFLIDFPSGAWVRADIGTAHMDIHIHAPEDDFAATQGLCGTFNGHSTDDLTGSNGQVHPFSSKPDAFVESWRVKIGESMFDKEVPIDPKLNNDIYYCNCDKAKSLVDCRVDNKASRPAVHTRCVTCNRLVAGNAAGAGNGRKKRAADAALTDGPLTYHFDYGFLDFPMEGTFPTKSGITQAAAEKTCRDAHNTNPTVQQCISHIRLDISASIDACVDDIKQMDNHDFVTSAVETSITDCVEKAITYPQYYDNSTGLPPAFITTDRCSVDCAEHGICVHGTCRCHTGYTGESCEINTRQPPTLFGIDTTDSYVRTSKICDVKINPCTSITIYGENVQSSSNLHCNLVEMKFDGSQFVATGKTHSVGADYISMYSVACRMPRPSTIDGHVPIGYNISVSNNGHQFSNAVPSYIVDSTCLSCPPSGGHCTIKPDTCLIDGICRTKGQASRRSADHVCDPTKNNKAWTDIHPTPATHRPTTDKTTHKATAAHVTSGHIDPTIPYPVAPLGGIELTRFDVWTTTQTGCECYFDPTSHDCACCDDGGCQCDGVNKHQCVQCGKPASCGTPQTAPDFGVDGYTLALADCQCIFNPTLYNCACCQSNVNACQCGAKHKNQCVDCKHMDRCGSKPWLFGPPMH